jgi:hypothetical protein
MATAGKEAKLEGFLSGGGGGGKEREHSEYSHILADVINYCGVSRPDRLSSFRFFYFAIPQLHSPVPILRLIIGSSLFVD